MDPTTLNDLHHACKREGFTIALDLVGPTGHRARDEECWDWASLRLRVLTVNGDVVAGRCQSDPGLEGVDQLADGVAHTLRQRGLIA